MNRNNHPIEIDHIDPRWKEGRDYQLVCGLDCPLNYREEYWKRNTSKSNRFLPWRWSRDEVGVVPEEYGDLAQFLVNGEWVLLEFLSDEWFAATKHTTHMANLPRHYSHLGVAKQWETLRANPELLAKRNERIAEATKERNAAGNMHAAQRQWREDNPEEYYASKRKASASAHEHKYKCTVTGHVSSKGGLTIHQRNRNIDPSNRIKLN
jgi:hypothetical protein